MATPIKVSLKQATLRKIRGEDLIAKAAVHKRGRIDYIPSFNLNDGSERAREVVLYYRPYLLRRDDFSLLCELKYWGEKFRSEFDIPDGKPLDLFLTEHVSLHRKMKEREMPRELTDERRQAVRRACIALRWQFVPSKYFRGPGPSLPEMDSPRTDHRDLHLGKVSNWRLTQKLTSFVGSCDIAPHELSFLARNWKKAWEAGPEHFQFETAGHREWAENLCRSILDRDCTFYPDQIQMFRKMTGFIRRIPVWMSPETQTVFPEFGGGQVRLKPIREEEEEERRRSTHPGQGDLFASLEFERRIAEIAKLALLRNSEPKWDGGAKQIDLF